MSHPDWANLPSVVLFDLYHLLSVQNRISASSTCKRWREAFYFYPNWRKLDLSTAHCNHEKNHFLATKGKKSCRTLSITYVAENYAEVSEILKDLTCTHRLTEFQLVGSGEPVVPSFLSQFSSAVYPFMENCSRLSSLFLFHLADLDRLNRFLSKHKSSMLSLGIGALYSDSDQVVSVDTMVTSTFTGFSQLHILQMDGMWVTKETVLSISEQLPSLKLMVLSLKENNTVGDIPRETWEIFNERLPRCEIRLNYLRMCKETDDTENSPYILSMAKNITHLRMIYCSREFQEKCVNALMRERALLHTLTSIWSISDGSNRDLFIRHPFVVCAWRFKHLNEMILSGSLFDDYDLIGMTRMRLSLNIHIAREDIAVQEGGSFRPINAIELKKLTEELSNPMPKSKTWAPMDARRFNDLSLPLRDREAHTLKEIFAADVL